MEMIKKCTKCSEPLWCKGLCKVHYEKERYKKLKEENHEYLKEKSRKHRRTFSHKFWKAQADARKRNIMMEALLEYRRKKVEKAK